MLLQGTNLWMLQPSVEGENEAKDDAEELRGSDATASGLADIGKVLYNLECFFLMEWIDMYVISKWTLDSNGLRCIGSAVAGYGLSFTSYFLSRSCVIVFGTFSY